jgi:hypothetical protein
MLRALKLQLTFDADRLQADVKRAVATPWRRHFNRAYYQGDWSGIALRSNSPHSGRLYTDRTRLDAFQDEPALERCEYVPEVLRAFACPLRAVRFLSLAPGAVILEHTDGGLSREDGEVRLHIPVTTNPEVELIVGGEPLTLLPGECWYINADLPHRAANRGTSARVHLVIDAALNPWLDSLLGNGSRDVNP